MYIITYGFGDSSSTIPVYGFLGGTGVVPPAVVDIEFDVPVYRYIEFTMNITRTINLSGSLS